ncbi:hypothetical protein SprV_0702301100 [Sparganum proliferum]
MLERITRSTKALESSEHGIATKARLKRGPLSADQGAQQKLASLWCLRSATPSLNSIQHARALNVHFARKSTSSVTLVPNASPFGQMQPPPPRPSTTTSTTTTTTTLTTVAPNLRAPLSSITATFIICPSIIAAMNAAITITPATNQNVPGAPSNINAFTTTTTTIAITTTTTTIPTSSDVEVEST